MHDLVDTILPAATSSVQTVSSADVTAVSLFGGGFIRRVYPCTSGTLAIKRISDGAFTPYPVFAGQPIDGRIAAVGGTGSGSTSGVQWIAEQ